MNNPYQASLTPQPSERPDDIPGAIFFREFRAKPLSVWFSPRRMMTKLREQAASYINAHIRAKNVISVIEHQGFDYSIIVWYRGDIEPNVTEQAKERVG